MPYIGSRKGLLQGRPRFRVHGFCGWDLFTRILGGVLILGVILHFVYTYGRNTHAQRP